MYVGEAMKIRFRPGLRLSDEAFWRLCRANPDLRLERSARGELIVMSPSGADSGRRNLGLGARLWIWNDREQLGVAFDSSAGFTFADTGIRGPDAAWIAKDRWEALPVEDQARFAHINPDFVVELRSPSDSLKDLRDKMMQYRRQGVRLAWLLDPKRGKVEIYRPGRRVEILDRPPTLSGEDVLPGFVLDLKGILYD